MDEPAHERPCGAALRGAAVPALRGALVVPDHGRWVLGHQQHRQCMDCGQGVAVLALGRGKGKRAGLVLGQRVAFTGCDGLGHGAQEGALGSRLEMGWLGRGGGGGGGRGGIVGEERELAEAGCKLATTTMYGFFFLFFLSLCTKKSPS